MTAVVADAADAAELAEAVALAEQKHGALDAMIAAAGVIAGGVPLWEMPREQEEAVLDVDLRAVLTAARVAVPALLRRPQPRDARFIAVASTAATRGLPMLAAYTAAKAGVVGLVRALAAELRGAGVTANAVSPGSTRTAMLDESARLYATRLSRGVRGPAAARAAARPQRGGGDDRLAGRTGGQRRDGRRARRRRGTVGVTEPPPAELAVALHPAVRVLDRGRVLVGGSPLRVLRLTEEGARAIGDWGAPSPVGERPARRALARRLLDAGVLSPHPAPAAPTSALTVVVPARDRPAQLARCLEGVRASCPRSPVVVVDDGSRDPAAVHAVCAQHGVAVIRHDVSAGSGGGPQQRPCRQLDAVRGVRRLRRRRPTARGPPRCSGTSRTRASAPSRRACGRCRRAAA